MLSINIGKKVLHAVCPPAKVRNLGTCLEDFHRTVLSLPLRQIGRGPHVDFTRHLANSPQGQLTRKILCKSVHAESAVFLAQFIVMPGGRELSGAGNMMDA